MRLATRTVYFTTPRRKRLGTFITRTTPIYIIIFILAVFLFLRGNDNVLLKLQGLDQLRTSLGSQCRVIKNDIAILQEKISALHEHIRELTTKDNGYVRENVVIFTTKGTRTDILRGILEPMPELFYMPDVLRPLGKHLRFNPPIGSSLTTHLLHNLFKCDFSKIGYFLDSLKAVSRQGVRNGDNRIPVPLLCAGTQNPNATCSVETQLTEHFQNICRRSNISVFHVTHLSSLHALAPLVHLQHRSYKLKVIHLVRDPRATIHALVGNKSVSIETFTKFARKFCQQLLLNAAEGRKDIGLDKNSYKTLKIEDLVKDPIQTGKNIIKFLGLKMTIRMLDELSKNVTRGHHDDWKRKMTPDLKEVMDDMCARSLKELEYNIDDQI